MHPDLVSEIKVLPMINPAAGITGNGVTTGATIDSAGFESLTMVLQTGVVTDGAWATAIFGGNASNMSDEVQLTGTDESGADLALALTDDNITKRIGININKVGKQYYRIKCTQSAATTGGFLAALAILAKPRFAPVAQP